MKTVPMSAFVRRLSWALATFVLLICMATPVAAQYRGSLQGTVTDPQAGVVPNATVTLTSNETNISRTATTTSSGTYSISGLIRPRAWLVQPYGREPGAGEKKLYSLQLHPSKRNPRI
jgi:Carboxypeptidase regulatory-like domain